MYIDPWQFSTQNRTIRFGAESVASDHVEGVLDWSNNGPDGPDNGPNKNGLNNKWLPKRLLAMVVQHSLQLGNLSITGCIDSQNRSVLQFKGSFIAAWPCAHCGGPVQQEVRISRNLVLAKTEAQAEEWENLEEQWQAGTLDVDSDTDVVACPEESIEVLDWLEDEMLLSMPMVVRHPECVAKLSSGNSLTLGAKEDEPLLTGKQGTETRRPFAELAEWLANKEMKREVK